MIPNYESEVSLIKERHPQAWKDAHTGNPHTEDFIRLLAAHLHGIDPNVALNGKRGNPNDISDDALNILDPVDGPGRTPDGRRCWVVDVIGRAGSTEPDKPPVVQWDAIKDPVGSSGARVVPGAAPQPQPVPVPIVPGREEALDEQRWLHAYYKAPEGLQRPNGLWRDDTNPPGPDFEGLAAWYLDVYQQARIKGKSRAEARAEYVGLIRNSDEWKAKHPGGQP